MSQAPAFDPSRRQVLDPDLPKWTPPTETEWIDLLDILDDKDRKIAALEALNKQMAEAGKTR